MKPDRTLTCQEAIGLLMDYLDQLPKPGLLALLEAHLAACAPCRAYLNTYRRTAHLSARAAPEEMPQEVRDRLRDLLRDCLLRGELGPDHAEPTNR